MARRSNPAQRSNLAQQRADYEELDSQRRTEIIDAAEALFLERGIADTTMTDIAERVGVTRVTLYRYFAERDHLAFEVAGRMLEKLAEVTAAAVPAGAGLLETARAALEALITQFEHTRDAHRYLAMFNSLRPFGNSTDDLDRWFRARSLEAVALNDETIAARLPHQLYDPETTERMVTLVNVVAGALDRYATGGEQMAEEQGITLDAQLRHLVDIVLGYFDAVVAPQNAEPG